MGERKLLSRPEEPASRFPLPASRLPPPQAPSLHFHPFSPKWRPVASAAGFLRRELQREGGGGSREADTDISARQVSGCWASVLLGTGCPSPRCQPLSSLVPAPLEGHLPGAHTLSHITPAASLIKGDTEEAPVEASPPPSSSARHHPVWGD